MRQHMLQKTHTTNVATFQTPTFGPIDLCRKIMLYISKKLVKEEHYEVNTTEKKVYLLKAYAGMDEKLINAVCDLGADGLVYRA